MYDHFYISYISTNTYIRWRPFHHPTFFAPQKIFSKILLYILIEGDVKRTLYDKEIFTLLTAICWLKCGSRYKRALQRQGYFFLYLQCHKTCLNKISLYLRFLWYGSVERECVCMDDLVFVHYWVRGWLCEWGDGGEM
jgi:hypothetical protein